MTQPILYNALEYGTNDPGRDMYSQIADAMPFDREVEPVFSERDVQDSISHRAGMLANGVAAAYDDYYARTTIRFNADDTIPTSLPKSVLAIPRSDWRNWNIVLSGVQVYAEPVSSGVLERGAVARGAVDVIEEAGAELDAGDLAPKEAARRLRMLGHLPFAYSGIRGMEADAIKDLLIEQSIVESHPDEGYLVVHTPRGEAVSPKLYANSRRLMDSQSRGRVESVRFWPDGTYKPEGFTHELRYGRGGIPVAQVKFLRRLAVGTSQAVPLIGKGTPKAIDRD